jgi:hypothetical protein
MTDEDKDETLDEWERMRGVWPSRYFDDDGDPVPGMDAVEFSAIITETMFVEDNATEADRSASLLAATRIMRYLIDNFGVTTEAYQAEAPEDDRRSDF